MNRLNCLFILTLLMSGCGLTVHSDPVKVDPITVNHYVQLNVNQTLLRQFFTNTCDASLVAGYTQQELDTCVQKGIDEFLSALTYSSSNGTNN